MKYLQVSFSAFSALPTPDCWIPPPEPPCGGWALMPRKTLTMIRLTAGKRLRNQTGSDMKIKSLNLTTISIFRGWGVQWNDNGGRCGVCGDPWSGNTCLSLVNTLKTLFICQISHRSTRHRAGNMQQVDKMDIY